MTDVESDAEAVGEAQCFFSSAMPKEEIGAIRFLKEHPDYDGRGTVIAIFDTGVDPGAAGLQITSDGKPKIIDVIDCTGSGDVDTSKVEKVDDEGFLKGASGRKLQVNKAWVNPSGEWHVGCKHMYQLFSKGLVRRCQEVHKKKWLEQQRLALVDATAAIAAFNKRTAGDKPSDAIAKEKAELEVRVTYLRDAAKSYEDPGPMLDCVVWHDGDNWRVALDSQELYDKGSLPDGYVDGCTGLLSEFEPMTDFKIERKYGTFSALDACNFAVNVYDEGNTLSIVVDCGAHGTHVAGITAAHFPDDPGMNGIAPGAQIVSCKIGDTRLGSMETGTGLTRALIAVLSHKCDLINMSYGEPTTTPNSGRFIELATEIVNKHGVIFVASAGNAGPALSTVGAPGGTTSAMYAIGAYVSPSFAAMGHSVRETPTEGVQYTWSSRGPTPDGHVGVTFSAPGGAIAPVPQWTQQKRQLMNGTSMSSPNACGGIALLLSGLKATGGAISAGRVRRAVENTCLPLGGNSPDAVLTYGRGLIQVDEAFKYLERSGEVDSLDIRYEVSCVPTDAQGRSPRRGVYLRHGRDTARPCSFTVTVTPKLHEDALNGACLAVEDRVLLEPSVPWVSCPSNLLLHHSPRGFELLVNATHLPEGLHYGEVAGYDAKARWRGPLFRVAVTIIRPIQVPASFPQLDPSGEAILGAHAMLGPIAFKPGTEHREFYSVPQGATWAEVTLRAGPHDTPKLFLLRAAQLQPGESYKDTETRLTVTLSSQAEYTWNIPVIGGSSMELTMAQFWNSLGPSTLSADIAFHGVSVEGGTGEVFLDGACMLTKVVAEAPLRNEKIKAEAKLTHLSLPLRPTESVLEPMATPRDTLPDGRVIYRLTLTYKLDVKEAGKYKPTMPSINKLVYDSVVESQFYNIHDYGKRLVSSGDSYPESVSLKKGEHVIRIVLRHDNTELLENMRNMTMVVERALDNSITVPVYASKKEALSGGSSLGEFLLRGGEQTALYLGPLPDDKIPKDAGPGRVLKGKLTLGQLQRGSGAAPTHFPLTYVVPPEIEKPASSSGNGSRSSEPEKITKQKLVEAVRDTKIKFLKDLKLDGNEEKAVVKEGEGSQDLDGSKEEGDVEGSMEREEKDGGKENEMEAYYLMLTELKLAFPGHLPLLTGHLKKVDGVSKSVRNTKEGLTAVLSAADDVIAAIDAKELACHVALKCTEESPEAQRVKKEMDEKKSALVDALRCKCVALLDLEELEATGCVTGSIQAAAAASSGSRQPAPTSDAAVAAAASERASGSDAFQCAMLELRKWVDTSSDNSCAILHAKAEARAGRLTNAIKALDRAIGDDKAPKKELFETRCALLKMLGWSHLERMERDMLLVRFQPGYSLN